MATSPSFVRETVRSQSRNPVKTIGRTAAVAPVCYAYLDDSNIFLGGASFSAWRRGMAPSPRVAAETRVFDPDFRLNFTWLRQFAVGDDVGGSARTICVGSVRAGSDSTVSRAYERSGWTTYTQQRAKSGREKEVETMLTVAMVEDLLCSPLCHGTLDVTLFSGDRDMRRVVELLGRQGIAVDVVAWEHTASMELRQAARRFIALDRFFDFLALGSPRA